jgi:hypothetical protein
LLVGKRLFPHLMPETQMHAATFSVLGNFKIFTTAILYRAILDRPLSSRKWLALGLGLFVGSVINATGTP